MKFDGSGLKESPGKFVFNLSALILFKQSGKHRRAKNHSCYPQKNNAISHSETEALTTQIEWPQVLLAKYGVHEYNILHFFYAYGRNTRSVYIGPSFC